MDRTSRLLGREERAAEHGVDGREEGDLVDERVRGDDDEAEHGEAAVPHLGGGREARVEGRDEARGLLVGLALLEEECVLERERAPRRAERHHEEVDVGDEDAGALVRDGQAAALAAGDDGERAPLLEVEQLLGVGNQPVRLAVARRDDEGPAEHGVAAVPPLGLHTNTPAVRVELGKLLLEHFRALLHEASGRGFERRVRVLLDDLRDFADGRDERARPGHEGQRRDGPRHRDDLRFRVCEFCASTARAWGV